MKRTLGVFLGLGIVILLGWLFFFGGTTITIDNEARVIATSTDAVVKPTAAEMLESATQELILEAIAASSTDIMSAKEEAAERIELDMERAIERDVRAKMKAENDARIVEIDKETKAY